MKMDFQYDYGSLERIAFEGLNGCETVRDMKNALELLKIENPKRTFQERVRAGEYDDTPEDEYLQIVDAVEFIATLWRYPDAKTGELAQPAMNVLMLLANAIEMCSKQNATLIRHNTGRRGIMGKTDESMS